MDKEITNEEDDFDIDELLGEDEDSPTEEIAEEIVEEKKEEKKGRGRPKGIVKAKAAPEVSIEVANIKKELSEMEWQPYAQPAFDGFTNIKTGEMIDDREAIRRTLCYAQEAARNSR